ncbi:tyrosyl-DNA phosphodiesterase 1 [Trichonephila inaurata madagascariensis]|uniref:Tyrosyl-DNA phosphodiesterase 1 n=1 Tax=Trichonephila inaurata madagascariensis TaxID=2747483 RepID=A0A8X6XWV1_9ARAC|nr:tyrosyl-DNA phosphodiesterase 1 [Trichonephila inaurata madagascariensis]
MNSDSDRTIDSDELEEIIRQSQKNDGDISDKPKKIQRRPSFHDLSDTDSEAEILEKKQKVTKSKTSTARQKCEYGKNCYRKNLDHLKNFDHGSEEESRTLSVKSRKRNKYDIENPKEGMKIKSKHSEISGPNSESETPNKRKKESGSPSVSNIRPKCPYGKKCYRKNPDHINEFDHKGEECEDVTVEEPSSEKSQKLPQLKCHNFQFYVTKVNGIHQKYNMLALDIKDILSFKDGSLVKSAQFNYMFDIEWLMQQYPEKYRSCPLTIVHGEQREAKKSLEKSGAKFPNITFCQAKLDIPFGTHHTKMMFLLYKEGFRIVIHTSNIVDSDWFQRTQGMWVSPVLLELRTPSAIDGNSPTNFKTDLLEYVTSYNAQGLEEWLQVIKRHDFSKVKVVLIGSVPGRHVGSKKTSFGHLKLRKVLNHHGSPKETVNSDWPVICQFSSIGSLGASPDQWLRSEFCTSLATTQNAPLGSQSASLKLVYPTVENVRKSLQGYPAGASLPYSIKVAQKQPYLKHFLHQWKSEKLGRSEASPHIKTYIRISPNNSNIAWFLLTSANLSKAAWGALEKKGAQFMIRSYELGVLFLPKFFGIDFFSIPGNAKTDMSKLFPIPYDIPLEPYSKDDEPWIWDIPHIKAPDRYGMKWCPP